MKLIINTVNLRIGGAFQRSISFLNEIKEFTKDEFHVFYNDEIAKQIAIDTFPSNFKFYYFDQSPASLKHRKRIIKEFDRIEKEVHPDAVFSFVGPCYWRASSPHLVGYGIPHIVYDEYKYVKQYSWKTKLEMIYKKWWTKYEADYWVVQTEDVRQRLSKRLNVDVNKVFLVSNGIGQQYKNAVPQKRNDSNVKKLLMISTYRPSKNFDIIKEVIPFLENDTFQYEFHITINKEDYDKNFKGFEKSIINHGHVKASDCPALYNMSDAMFLPSHLECFSASYPEAMKMQRPILTSNLSFATTVCEDAGLYFDNTNPNDVADKIKKLFHSPELYDDLVMKGNKRLNFFDNSRQQAEKYLHICDLIRKRP
ncbi:glycosyltransferase involved in cell wall biosynthesis [Flavobacterium arsenatis]|uniref:Glycosyltransferase involved in cell wall biosynthesis n=1 Tax=Flavobacterium arsenatis TaxID=1484332 RepID=A0ABU1TQN1_9FLAO|nr:glycosyltransferase family 4 protein [Flavobacterium arsenatis]MDR6968289.1 glycosyltransferase involved in cell wall biosynthesis [Flavobacterium arsenatis]